MPLIKCTECAKDISSAAPACPHCGRPNPAITVKSSKGAGCLGVIVTVGLGLALLSYFGNHSDQNSAAAPTVSTVPDSSIVSNDSKSLADKYGTYASSYCASDADDYLRTASQYAFKWDEIGFLGSKFDMHLKGVSSPGVLTLVSNKVELQNGFGGYERIELFCDYDTQHKKILGYSINGRPQDSDYQARSDDKK